MFGLAKIALDAMKAREMAKSVGLVPEAGSAWKWALRQMRDGRGDLLQGKELADAKADIGKTPNNVRQKVQAMSRKFGHRYEVATAIKDDPEWQQRLLGQKVTRESVSSKKEQIRRILLRMYQADPEAFMGGELTNRDEMLALADRLWKDTGIPLSGTGQLKGMYNAVRNNRMSELGRKVSREGVVNIGNEGSVSGRGLYDRTTQTHIHTHPFVSAEKFHKGNDDPAFGFYNQLEHRRVGSKGAPLVSPSGWVNRGRPDMPMLPVTHGATLNDLASRQKNDYGIFLEQRDVNPNTKFNIIDPNFGNEGVHKLRPQGDIRSVYFKNNV